MANPFDQFDNANPFDQFDAGPSIFEQRPAAKPFEYGSASEALGGLMDIGAMIGAGGTVAARQIAEKPVQPLVDVARGAVALPMMAGQAAMGDVQAQQQLRGLPADIFQNYAQAYGSPKAAFMTAATEPGRFATDIMGLPAVGGIVGAGARATGEGALGATRGVLNRILPIARDEAEIQNRLAALTTPAAPADIRAAYERGVQIPQTPGMPAPTLAEATAAGGVELPGLAALEKSFAGVATPETRALSERSTQKAAAIRDQLARVEADIQDRADILRPEQLANLRTIRDSLMQQLAVEQAGLETQAQAVGARLRETGQRAPGEVLAGRAETLQREMRREQVRPTFRRAFREAGNAPIDTTGVIRRTEQILGRPLSEFAPETAPQTVRLLQNLPEQASLRDLDEVRKAVGLDIAGAERSMAPGAAQTLPNLYGVYDAIRTAIARSPELPETARNLYNRGLEMHREEVVPRFRTGIASDILRTTGKNEPGLLPDKIVNTFIRDERGAQQFATTYRNDPAARQAMLAGIEDLARKEAVDPTTRMVNPAAIDKFIADHNRQFNIMGVDPNVILQPVREEALRLQTGMETLAEQARNMRKASYVEVVDEALKSAPSMDFLRRRIQNSPEAMEALAQEVSNRVLANVNTGEPKLAMKMLNEQRRSIIGAVGKEQYDAMRGLAEDQLRLQEVAKTAPKTDAQLKADISKFSRIQKTDLETAIRDIQRIKQMERLSETAPANLGEKVAMETPFEWYNPLSYPYNLIRATQRYLKKRQDARISATMAKLIVDDPDRMLRILETGRSKPLPGPAPAKPPMVPGRFAVIPAANVMSQIENRNAMAR